MKQHGIMTTAALLAAISLSLTSAALADDTFDTRNILPAGVLSVSGDIEGDVGEDGEGSEWPDLTLGAFDENGDLFDWDDDGSHLGDSLASGLYDMDVNADGTIYLSVSGYDDFDFDGIEDGSSYGHEYYGEFTLYVETYDEFGDFIDEWIFEDELFEGETTDFDLDAPQGAWTFDAYLDNAPYDWSPTGEDYIDFVTFTGLTPGDAFFAEITEGDFDTMLGWYDDNGDLIDYSDDIAGSLLSGLDVVVPDSGELHLAVTGYPWYEGNGITHPEAGEYTLELVVPEPATLSLLTIGGAALLRRRRAC